MRSQVIKTAVDVIAARRSALLWLDEHGGKLTGKKDDVEGKFGFDLWLHPSDTGAEEATRMMEEYARSYLPEIAEAAAQACRNDIEINVARIRDELDTP